MNREILNPASEAEWLELRKEDITSTMAPALFDLSPYATLFELYHAKKSGLDTEIKENDRMAKGKRMEEYAAQEVCLEHGFTDLRRMDEYIRIPDLRIGSSFDFEVMCPKRGLGLLEMKAVDYAQFKEKWELDEAPEHIEVQAQHQLLTAGSKYKWSGIAAFYSLYDHCLLIREPDQEFHQGILDAVADFWRDVDNGNEPKPDYYRDCATIKALYECSNETFIDCTDNEAFEVLCGKYLRLKDEEKGLKSEIEAAQAQIIEALAGVKGGYTNAHKASIIQVKDTPATIITKEMVGQEIGGRKGHIRLNVKEA
jgi:predicted phage-related endonuclease